MCCVVRKYQVKYVLCGQKVSEVKYVLCGQKAAFTEG